MAPAVFPNVNDRGLRDDAYSIEAGLIAVARSKRRRSVASPSAQLPIVWQLHTRYCRLLVVP